MNRKVICGLAVVCLGAWVASAQGSIIFDDFNVNEGHFTLQPSFAGQSNVATTSTADRITSDSLEGAGSEKLVLNVGATNPARSRFLSGSGTPANNPSFTITAGTDGWIGFYAKTSASGIKATIALDLSTNAAGDMDGGVQKTLIGDGAWHLYEWDLDNAADWAAVTGIAGNGILDVGGVRTVDSIFIYNVTANSEILIDFVAKSDSGSIAALVPEPTTLALVGVAGLLFRRRRSA